MGFIDNIGGGELILLILLGMFIFGPDRLPKAISDALRTIRQLRQMASNATAELSREIGTTIELEDLHPKTFLRKHLLSEEDERMLRRPLENLYGELKGVSESVTRTVSETVDMKASVPATSAPSVGTSEPTSLATQPHRFDVDAT